MTDVDILGQGVLEFRNFRTVDILSMIQYGAYPSFEVGSDSTLLGGEIDEFH